ncbi:MAG: four helix bundle protein [Armatimonadetes bacterium]|nr:four helix bundle protein [Armatimonadota bacterium]
MMTVTNSGITNLTDRMLDFAAATIKLVNRLPRTTTGRHIGAQFLRAGTSAAANYEEACAAESRADFLHKLQIVLKELRESRFWLRLVDRAELIPESEYQSLLKESQELCNIIGKSIVTTRAKA